MPTNVFLLHFFGWMPDCQVNVDHLSEVPTWNLHGARADVAGESMVDMATDDVATPLRGRGYGRFVWMW
jgi:hypothetical protein